MQKNPGWENKAGRLRKIAEVIFIPAWVSFQRKEGLDYGI